jgi:hypothetical protein
VSVTLWSFLAGRSGTLAAAADPSGWSFLTDASRLDLYRHSLSLVQDFPFTGIGLGDQFAMVLSRHALLIQVPFLTYPHNTSLSTRDSAS